MKYEVRQPRQERSIEKKNRIIKAGYILFSEVGYYGTNTAEIAKKAGVSTGIIYGYFQDKRDIMISVLDIYIEQVIEPVLEIFDSLGSSFKFSTLIERILDTTIKAHKNNAKIHEALRSLTPSDEVVRMKFIESEDKITNKIADKLLMLGIETSNPKEKVHLAMNIMQSFSHEFVFDKHAYIDYNAMKEMVLQTVISLFIK